jgi:PIN domain nuclease of toxin-antitoxin system
VTAAGPGHWHTQAKKLKFQRSACALAAAMIVHAFTRFSANITTSIGRLDRQSPMTEFIDVSMTELEIRNSERNVREAARSRANP